MKTNNEQGRRIAVAVGVYLIVKTVLNMIIGGGFDFAGTVTSLVLAVGLYSGLQYVNIAVGVVIAVTVLRHIGYNVTHLPSTLIFVIEAVVDAGCLVLLIVKNEVREHFTNKWNEISELINK